MRFTLTCLFALVMGRGVAQFNGKLVYQIDNNGVRTVMTYIQNGTNAIVEAYTGTLKNGALDTTTCTRRTRSCTTSPRARRRIFNSRPGEPTKQVILPKIKPLRRCPSRPVSGDSLLPVQRGGRLMDINAATM